jgi:hypothetical protein
MLSTGVDPSNHVPDFGERREVIRLDCETDSRCTWIGEKPLRSDALIDCRLPHVVLPDNRRAWVVPTEQSFGTILKVEWEPIVDRAKDTQKPILLHAYEVTLAVLQCWRKLVDERRRDPKSVDSPWDEVIRSWVYRYAQHLHDAPSRSFVPFEEAKRVLARITGFGPEGIQTAIRRTRSAARGRATSS